MLAGNAGSESEWLFRLVGIAYRNALTGVHHSHAYSTNSHYQENSFAGLHYSWRTIAGDA
jgi:hypothetical protein